MLRPGVSNEWSELRTLSRIVLREECGRLGRRSVQITLEALEQEREGWVYFIVSAPGDGHTAKGNAANTTTSVIDALFVRGEIHAPYFIFIRGEGRYSDADLLRLFGLSEYRPTKSPRQMGRHVMLVDDGPWKMVVDDWWYTLWHMPSTRQVLQELGRSCEVFSCSVGESDRSFDFEYYQGGRLLRQYILDDPSFPDGKGVMKKGKPLPGEGAAFKERDELRIVLSIAASVGIKTQYEPGEVRVYSPVEEQLR